MSSSWRKTPRVPFALLASALLLSACGGGNDAPSAAATPDAVKKEWAAPQATHATRTGTSLAGTGWRGINAPYIDFLLRQRLAINPGSAPVYVDAVHGNDNNDGTEPAKAWRTLSKVTRQSLAGKTAVLLECNSKWSEPLVIEGPSGYNSQPAPADRVDGLLISAYNCQNRGKFPTILGMGPLNVTALSRGSEWVYPIAASQKPLRAYKVVHPESRTDLVVASYPDQAYGPDDPVFLRIGGAALNSAERKKKLVLDQTTAQAPDKVADNPDRIVGATIHVKTRPWALETRTITAYNPTTREVTLSSDLTFAVTDTTAGYILEGLPWMMDQANEWLYASTGPSQGEVRLLKAPGETVAPQLWTGRNEAGLKLKWVKNVTVQRVQFDDHPLDAISAQESPNLTIQDVFIQYAGRRGVTVHGLPKSVADRPERATIANSLFYSSGVSAIEVRSVPGTHILNNQFTGQDAYGTLRGAEGVIYLAGDSGPSLNPARPSRIADNLIENSPGTGIRTMTTSDVEITGNAVVSFCEQTADCGGIYVGGPGPWMDLHTGPGLPARPEETAGRGGLISNNIVAGGASNFNGFFHTGSLKNQAIGIYLDETSNKVQVQHNTVSGTEIGIYLHDAFSNTVTNNTVRGARHASIALKARRSDKILENNEISHNVLFSHRSVTLPADTNKEIVALDEDKTVYAMTWESESINIADLFTGTRANRVHGNQILTVRNGLSPVWRRQENLLMGDGGGALWWVRNYAAGAGVRLGHADWLQFSGQTAPGADTLSASLAYRQYNLSLSGSQIVGGQPFDSNAWQFHADTSVPLAQRGTFVFRSSPACDPACGELKAGHQYDYLRSKDPFSLDHQGNNLYVVRYQARSMDAQAPASVRLWANYSDAQGGLNIPGTPLPAGGFTQIEQFFRVKPPSGAVAGPDMKLYVRAIGNVDNLMLQRTAQFRDLALHKVNGITYRPDMSEISLNVVNFSRTDSVTVSVSALNVPANSTWVNESGQTVNSLPLGPRQSVQIFRQDDGWLLAP